MKTMTLPLGYIGKILWIDLTNHEIQLSEVGSKNSADNTAKLP